MPAANAGRKDAFDKFHKELGHPPFSPEFETSLVAVMADPDTCLADRVYAWCRWRSWGNSSLTPISDWENGYPLDQQDCALDLAWLADGKKPKDVKELTQDFRRDARRKDSPERPLRALSKQRMSEAFNANIRRGTVRYEGASLLVPPAPEPPARGSDDAPVPPGMNDAAFLEWVSVRYAADCENYLVRRAQYHEARKVRRAQYREYVASRTQNGPILIDVITTNKPLINTHTESGPESGDSLVCAPVEVSSDPPETPVSPEVPPNALIRQHNREESWACFWSVYSGFSDSRQEEAKRWWFRHVRSDEYAGEIMGGLLRWKVSDRWSRGVVQHAVNFLKNHEYRENPPPPRQQNRRQAEHDQLQAYYRKLDEEEARARGKT